MEETKSLIGGLISGNGLNPWIYTTCVFLVVLGAGIVARRLLWSRLTKITSGTSSNWDNELLGAISAPVTVLLVVLAFGIAGQSAPVVIRTHPLIVQIPKVTMIVVMVWLLERALSVLLRSSVLPTSLSITTRALFVTIVRSILLVLGFLVVLDTIGVSITPILASLGVGSVAVALALQDTLSNFFGGLYILVDKPIRLGDWVKVDDVEGQVERIGWRSTRIRLGTNDTVVLPNTKVASTQLKNYDMPSSLSSLLIPCGVAYGSDLERVEKIAIEVAIEVSGRIAGADANFKPVVMFREFADSSINFVTVLQVKRFDEFGPVRHEFIKALHARFNREKIEIPYPQRVVHWNPGPAIVS